MSRRAAESGSATLKVDEMETKMISPVALAGITTAVLLEQDGFSKIHEAFEWIMGHPVWTHEMPGAWSRARALVLDQFPEMPGEGDVEARGFAAVADEVRQRYGNAVEVRQGTDKRTANPVETAEAVMSSKH